MLGITAAYKTNYRNLEYTIWIQEPEPGYNSLLPTVATIIKVVSFTS